MLPPPLPLQSSDSWMVVKENQDRQKKKKSSWKLVSTKLFKFEFCANNSSFDKYSFQLIVLLKPDFNCANNFAISWVDKVTTGT